MRTSEVFGGNTLKAEDLKGRRVVVEIEDVKIKEFDKGSKPILTFVGKDKAFVVNRTNAAILTHILKTDEMDEWVGRRIALKPDRTMFQGSMVACIRVEERLPSGAAPLNPEAPVRKPAPEPEEPEWKPTDEDVPF